MGGLYSAANMVIIEASYANFVQQRWFYVAHSNDRIDHHVWHVGGGYAVRLSFVEFA